MNFLYESTSEFEFEEVPDNSEILSRYRKWFRGAVEKWNDWRNEALEDYRFVAGKQWTDSELAEFEKQKRPALTINRIKPLINILSGWQRLNRYDIDFLPRTADDAKLCEVRSGVTKYVMDRCNYEHKESSVFLDCATGGMGWFGVKYKFDYESNRGEAEIERVDPFSMYIDPESHELDFSDAKFICRAKWVDKDELKAIYPDKADDIENNYNVYDPVEKQNSDHINIDPLWYSQELQKIRVVECWYKEKVTRTMIRTADGKTIPFSEETKEQIMQLMMSGVQLDYQDVPITQVKLCVFFDKTLLENIDSPYQHGEFPYVPLLYHYYGVGDTPAGFVRDLKDPQREINKRRIQEMHILNTSSNGGGYIEEGAMTPEQFAEFEEKNAIPGHFNRVVSIAKIQEREPKAPPAAVINAEQQATADLMAISGINENLLGTDIASNSSGRAIELKQKQAVTHLATIFDNLRSAKKRLAYLLWGTTGHAGIIPQFYTAEDVYRVESENGQQFIPVNQQIVQQDPLAGIVVKILNDLSVGEFDIVISDVEASVTKRRADLWTLVDAGSKLGLPAQLLIKPVLDLADVPKRDEIIAMYQQMQQQEAQSQQAERDLKLQIEEIKNQDSRQIITFKDAPLPIQMAMAAKAGIIPQEFANELIKKMIEQMTPQLAQQMQQQAQMQAMQAQQQQQMQMQNQPPQQVQQQPQVIVPPTQQQIENHQKPQTMTDAAAKSIMLGSVPEAI